MAHRGVLSAVRGALVFGVAAAWAAGTAPAARGDKVVLRGGGQVRGKVLPDPDHRDRVTVLTERGKTPLSFVKAQIVEVVPEPSALDGYLAKRDALAATAESHYELGLWCDRHKLADLAVVHYEAALKADKGYAPAHQKLGHLNHAGRWLSGDEVREAQGLVRHKGRWITREEKDEIDKGRAAAAEQASWVRRIKLLREAAVFGADDRRREAESQLMAIREAVAVGPLVKVLGDDGSEPMRLLLARVLGLIPGPEAASALVGCLLSEPDPQVRRADMDELERLKDPRATRQLVRALRSDTPEVVNRAAWAIANLNALPAVPSLVAALLTTKSQVVMAPSPGGPAEGPGGVTATFGSVPPTSSMLATPVAYNGSSVGYLTSPVVGPGVVAFGATSVPFYPVPNPLATLPGGMALSGTGINAGGGVNGTRGPVPRVVNYTIQNVEVLSALVKLTGEDFGYDVAAWKRWMRSSFQPDPTPARHVPQP